MRPKPQVDQQFMAQMKQGLKETLSQSISDLEHIASTVDASRLFVGVIANLLSPPPYSSNISLSDLPSVPEQLAYYLYPFFEKTRGNALTAHDCAQCIKILQGLSTQSLMSDLMSEDLGSQDAGRELANQIRVFTKTVRGSAYPEQTEYKIDSIQSQFEDWLTPKAGISPQRAYKALWTIDVAQGRARQKFMPKISERVLEAITEWNEAKKTRSKQRSPQQISCLQRFPKWQEAAEQAYSQALIELFPEYWPVSRAEIVDEGLLITQEEWAALVGMLGLTHEVREGMRDVVDVRARPLYVMPDGRLILINLSHAMDVLWERFDQLARTEQSFYDKKYQPAKAEWLEKRTVECLERVFPSGHIYQGLSYPDPDKAKGSTAEIDIAISFGPFLVLVEAKAKQFRLASQLGDISRLRTDLRENIEDAFKQARRAVRYIESVDAPEFREIKTGRKLNINKANLRRTYLLTVSLHELAGLATRLASLRDLNLFRDGEFPVSISVADLDSITQFCEGPDILLHYLERRVDVQKNASYVYGDELDLFAAYLANRLQATRLWEDGKHYDQVMLTGWSEQFDHLMEYRRGDREKAPDMLLQVPNAANAILKELRSRGDGSLWIAFALLSLPDDLLVAIDEYVRIIGERPPQPGMFRTSTYQNVDTVVTLVASVNLPMELLRERTQIRAHVEKYRRKATKGIAFGIALNNPSHAFEYAYLVDGVWQVDETIEKLIENDAPFVLSEGSKPPGRNDPCFCGSNRKFKKCCLTRMEEFRRTLSSE